MTTELLVKMHTGWDLMGPDASKKLPSSQQVQQEFHSAQNGNAIAPCHYHRTF
jgi:hypothetical protein